MDFKLMSTVFVTIFLAEIADKTQVATFLYAANSNNGKATVFAGSALALVVASAIAVFAGALLSQWLNEKVMARLAGTAFILVGIWTLAKG